MIFMFKTSFNEHATKAVRSVVAQGGRLLFLGVLLLSSFQSVQAQFRVSLGSSNMAANDCGFRVLTAYPIGGSGDYQYFWNSAPPVSANLGNGPSIQVNPSQSTTITVGVYDRVTGAFVQNSAEVNPVVDGNFNVFIPNVFTPNGDGVNDRWEVRSSNRGFDPIRAYAYDLLIFSRFGNQIYHRSGTDTEVGSGLIGGQITWDATGAPSNGVYNYSLRLFNCSNPNGQLYNGTVEIFALGGRDAVVPPLSLPLAVYPNPVSDRLTVHPKQFLQGRSVIGEKTAPVTVVADEYAVKLLNKFSQVLRSVTSRESEVQLDVSTLPEGTYFLQVVHGKESIRKQIMVSH